MVLYIAGAKIVLTIFLKRFSKKIPPSFSKKMLLNFQPEKRF